MRFLGALVAVACALAASAEPAGSSPRVQFGIQDDAWLEFGPGRLADRVARLDRLGFDAVRVTLDWHRIEPAPGEHRWSRADRLLRALHARGLAPVVTLWGTPPWANGGFGPNVAPLRADDFRAFAEAAAARYPFVRHWVLWNEPNKPIWLKPASPETYVARILNPGYVGIKSASPRALVGGGVTAPRGGRGGVSPVDFIRRLARARARLDAYAHHPYPVYPGDTPFRGGCACKTITMATLERLVRLVGQSFPRARIWLTEYAYQTNPPDLFGVSPLDQARFVGEAARRVYAAPRVDLLVHYLYRDEPDLGRWQSGLETLQGRPKPALAATMLPLAQVGRRGSRVVLWGQVRPGEGPQRYLLQLRRGGVWRAVGGVRLTDARGYLARTVVAPRGTQARLVAPRYRAASPPLPLR
ncbi:MAG TPA: family 1 glycosylhydrolase [Gaiellaceae bacterium]|nr:family 1 glycosylhydrolase [Gaiellaceae bacterium]